YRKFSDMLEEAIRAFHAQRLSDAEYLKRVSEIRDAVRTRSGDNVPSVLEGRDVAKAFYGIVRNVVTEHSSGSDGSPDVSAEAGVRIDEIILDNRIVNWTNNSDVQNRMKNEIEDMLCELSEARDLGLDFDAIDQIMEQCLDVARLRYAS
ncbi:MAG: type I restriction enzyme endonuclease domain-containing protein, partial [Dehalococcoidia bacterium]